jgi:dihydrofolate reductase
MTVILELSMSLDGFVAGRGVGPAAPMGEGGERLHDWMGPDETGSAHPADRAAARATFATAGAVVLGRRMFDLGEEPWGDDGTFGVPCFVVTHRPRRTLVKGPTSFEFVTSGAAEAVQRAHAAAGDRDVLLMGGADLAGQCLAAGLVDEVRLHLVPVLLGAGTRLFDAGVRADLEPVWVSESPMATHLTYRIGRPTALN